MFKHSVVECRFYRVYSYRITRPNAREDEPQNIIFILAVFPVPSFMSGAFCCHIYIYGKQEISCLIMFVPYIYILFGEGY